MKYIAFEAINNIFIGERIIRTEIKNDKELKEYLFARKNNLDNIEIFEASNKSKIQIKIDITLNQ